MASLPNTDVIPLRFVGKQWQMRKRVNGKRIEMGLGTANRAEAERRAQRILGDMTGLAVRDAWRDYCDEGMAKSTGWIRKAAARINRRIRMKGGSVTADMLHHIALRSGGKCEVLGLPFELKVGSHHPFQPSFDRIDATRGYFPDNLRMVCVAANYCMGYWGEAVFMQIAAAYVAKTLKDLSAGQYRERIEQTRGVRSRLRRPTPDEEPTE